MVALDMLGRRWSLRILWQLRHGERFTSREIQNACDISSPNVLTSRLKELRDAGVVSLEAGGGYALTDMGKRLLSALGPLAEWADEWAINSGREDLACYNKAQNRTKN